MPYATASSFLLFRQVVLLCAFAGILTAFAPWPGSAFFLVLCLYNAPRRPRLPLLLLVCGAFALGFGYAQWRTPEEPALPPLLRQVAERHQLTSAGRAALPPVFVRATVAAPTVLPDGRIRAVLEHVTLEQQGEHGLVREGYDGNILWTWHEPRRFVQAGETLRAQVEIIPLQGLANPATWDTKTYWNLQGVFFRATSNAKSLVTLEPPPRGLSRLYKALYTHFLLALPTQEGRSVAQAAATANATRRTHPLIREHLTRLAEQDAGEDATTAPLGRTASPPATGLHIAPGARLLPALLFGDRSFLSVEQTDLIARSTLAHSLALSGLHLGYAVLLGMGCALAVGACAPRLWLRWHRQAVALVCAVPLALLYLWLGQAPLSLLRAACMLFFWVLLIFLHRPKVLLDGLLAAVALLALIDPTALFDLRLQLSALSIVAIALSMPLVQHATNALCPFPRPHTRQKTTARPPWPGAIPLARAVRAGIAIMLLSLCIQVALLPLTVSAFGTVGLWFPLNMLWLPILGVVVMPLAFAGLMTAACGFTGIAHFFLTLASWPCEMLLRGLAAMDAHGLLLAPVVYRPHWMFWLGFWLLCLYLPAWFLEQEKQKTPTSDPPGQRAHHESRLQAPLWQRMPLFPRTRNGVFLCLGAALCAGTLVWSAWWRVPPGVGVRLLDVGHGQAIVVEWRLQENAGRILIDGGSLAATGTSVGKTVVVPTLTAEAWPSLDWVINTHPDTDHLGGLLYVLENMQVGEYAGNGDKAAGRMGALERAALATSGLHQQVLRRGQTLTLGHDLLLEVLWPPPLGDETDRSALPHNAHNDASLLLRLVWQGKPLALFCGDLERAGLEAVMRETAASLTAEVIVLPHHGSRHSLLPAFYDAVAPKAALVSTGFANQWHFPHAEVRAAWAARGVSLCNTAEVGQISIHWTSPGEVFMLTTARP